MKKLNRNQIAAILVIAFITASVLFTVFYLYPRIQYWKLIEVPGETTLLTRDPDPERTYNAFPKVVRIEKEFNGYENQILAVWYSGNSHVDKNGDGRIYGAYSRDEGQTWTSPFEIYDDPNLDCRNIGICYAPNGTLTIFFSKVNVSKMDTKFEAWEDFGYILSEDGGETWSEYHSLIHKQEYAEMGIATGNGYGDPVLIGDSIYILCYGYPNVTYEETHVAFMLQSNDNGTSWDLVNEISLETGISTSEADFWYENSLLFGFSRTQNTDKRYLYYIESSDTGMTWDLYRTDVLGDCPDIFRISDGRYIVAIRQTGGSNTYLGYFTLPSDFPTNDASQKHAVLDGLQVKCLSKATFGVSHGDVAYPSIIQLKNNRILCVYYDIDAGGVFAKIVHESDL